MAQRNTIVITVLLLALSCMLFSGCIRYTKLTIGFTETPQIEELSFYTNPIQYLSVSGKQGYEKFAVSHFNRDESTVHLLNLNSIGDTIVIAGYGKILDIMSVSKEINNDKNISVHSLLMDSGKAYSIRALSNYEYEISDVRINKSAGIDPVVEVGFIQRGDGWIRLRLTGIGAFIVDSVKVSGTGFNDKMKVYNLMWEIKDIYPPKESIHVTAFLGTHQSIVLQ